MYFYEPHNLQQRWWILLLYTKFEEVLSRYDLLQTQKKIILAVSGGVDSVVLFHLMQDIPEERRPEIVVVHINHELRPEAKQEEDFVQQLASGYGISFHTFTWLKSDHPESGIEEAARTIRYTFFKKVMNEISADVVMTAHHLDDQVETVLMKLVRGSSMEEILGIEESQPFMEGQLIRPLLSFSKEEIYRFAQNRGISYMEDSTNQELDFSRNRFRNTIIPLLKAENQKFNDHIEQFRIDLEDLLYIASGPIEDAYRMLVTNHSKQLSFQYDRFCDFSKPMQRALVHRILDTMYVGQARQYKTNYITLIQDWLHETEGNSRLELASDFYIEKSYNNIRVYQEEYREKQSNTTSIFTITEDTTNRVKISETEYLELVELTDTSTIENLSKKTNQLVFHADNVAFPLTVRHRLPGDRMSYRGLDGSKKIKDIFIDEKVPLKERDEVWVVEDASGKIIWLVSYRTMYLLSGEETDKLTYILKYIN